MLRDNLRKFREARGLSQQQLADELHVVRQTVSKWERGTSVPDADLLVALAQALQVRTADLLGEAPARDAETLALEAGLLKERVSQQTRMERIYRRSIVVLAVVCALTLAGGLAYSLGTQVNRFAEGFEQGFQLQGTWRVPRDEGPFTTVSFGFTDADEGVWQIADFSCTAPLNGYFKATADPNLYLLHNERHEEVGWANVAFTSAVGGKIDGLAFVQYESMCYQVKRVDDFVTHYDRDFGGLTQTHVDDPARFREEAEGASDGEGSPDEGPEGDPVEDAAPSKVWLEEWFTK